MERFVKGDVIVAPFPYSDLSGFKKRPSLVLAKLQGDELILCQITGKERQDRYSINLESKDFKSKNLNVSSVIRPNRLFTGNASLISYKAGTLNDKKIKEVVQKVIEILNQ